MTRHKTGKEKNTRSIQILRPGANVLKLFCPYFPGSDATEEIIFFQVVVVTGEEGEVNVVQMSAKLHWFDKGPIL